MLSGGVFTPRFVLLAVVGFALVVPIAVSRATWSQPLSGLVLTGVLAFSFGQYAYDWLRPGHLVFHDPVRERPLLMARLAGPRPVVVTSGLWYLQLWYYAPPQVRGNLLYLVDEQSELRYTGTDTLDRGYLTLRGWAPINVENYATFVAAHHEFEVYAMGSGWLLDQLRADGATIHGDGNEQGIAFYRVNVRRTGLTGRPSPTR
jgi:hypothetical protein